MPFTLETTPPEILIEAFANLLSPDRCIFTPDYSWSLDELIYNLPDDDLQAIALSITIWCQDRPEIFEALEAELNINKKSPSKFVITASPTLPSSFHFKDYQTLLKNKLRQSFPSEIKAALGGRIQIYPKGILL